MRDVRFPPTERISMHAVVATSRDEINCVGGDAAYTVLKVISLTCSARTDAVAHKLLSKLSQQMNKTTNDFLQVRNVCFPAS